MDTMQDFLAEIEYARQTGELLDLNFFQNAVRNLSIDLPEGSTQLAYSGSGSHSFIEDALKNSIDAAGAARFSAIDQTEVVNFLNDERVLRAMEEFGITRDQQFGANNQSLWGIASERYAQNVSGDIVAVVHNADPERVFGKVELEKLLENDKVTTINGIDPPAWMEHDDGFVMSLATHGKNHQISIHKEPST